MPLPELWDWQQRELDARRPDKWAWWASPRLGKTYVAALSLRRRFDENGDRRAVVTAPVRVLPIWRTWLHDVGLDTIDGFGLPTAEVKDRLKAKPQGVLLINDDRLGLGDATAHGHRTNLIDPIIRWVDGGGYVADESHRLASPSSQRGRSSRRLMAACRWGRQLTGTPVPNHYGNLWGQLSALDPQGFETYTEFKCVVPETKILTADLRWVPIGTVKIGDALVGFDESSTNGKHRSSRTSIVLGVSRCTKECIEVVTTRGTVVCSVDHQWLTENAGSLSWTAASLLRRGPKRHSRIVALPGTTWNAEDSYDAGWLAGMYDGEGCISTSGLSLSQNPGPTLERVKRLLTERGFKFRDIASKPSKPCRSLVIGDREQMMRLLGTIRPHRLLKKAEAVYTRRLSAGRTTYAKVLSVTPVGKREVCAVETTTGTFISEGLFSHNCRYLICNPAFPNKIEAYRDLEQLRALILSVVSVVRREDVFGPDHWQYIERRYDLPTEARRIYDQLADQWILEGHDQPVLNILARLTRFQQITSGFLPSKAQLLQPDADIAHQRPLHTVKIDAVLGDLGEIVASREKAVVVHRFTWEGEHIVEGLRKEHVKNRFVINGDTSADDALKIQNEFRAAKSGVAVVQIQSGGEGLDFATARHALIASQDFSFIHFEQVRDRIFAPGMARTVTFYRMNDTVDDLIAEIVEKKQDLHAILRNVDRASLVLPKRNKAA